MKDELAKTIKSIKEGEKEEFEKIIDKLNPIITKYVRAIYDGDKEDIREEYILALWVAVNKIQYVNSDGECLKYLHTSIKNKFPQIAITSWTPRGKNLGHGWSRRIYP